jgi:putative membrane protein
VQSNERVSKGYLKLLTALFVVEWIVLAIHPLDREAWILENVIAVFAIAVLVLTRRRLPFSALSYTLIFLFLALHEVGAHYTYSDVPYDEWSRSLFGASVNETFGWQRNHFDRLVHFLYGLLLAYPIREVFLRVADVRGFWGYFLPLDLTMSTSMLFELVEWLAAETFGGDLGMTYLGTQGDVWDAHKDMALASIGALIAMLITGFVVSRYKRDFAREWVESLRVKHPEPLGEVELQKLVREDT